MRQLAPLAAAVAATLSVGGAGAACGSEEKPQLVVALAGQTVPTVKLRSIADGLCEAARRADRGEIDAARQSFFGQSHEGLHLIARALQDDDRAATAALLEVKQKVEADFTTPSPGAQIAADLRRLAELTRSGLARYKVSVDACPASG
jgi:hypothetical protein